LAPKRLILICIRQVLLLVSVVSCIHAAPVSGKTGSEEDHVEEASPVETHADLDTAADNFSFTIIHNYPANQGNPALTAWLPFILKAMQPQMDSSAARNQALMKLLMQNNRRNSFGGGFPQRQPWDDLLSSSQWDDWNEVDPLATHPLLDRRSL
jgi:hypothetical protein